MHKYPQGAEWLEKYRNGDQKEKKERVTLELSCNSQHNSKLQHRPQST
jgi:hypothetical protein